MLMRSDPFSDFDRFTERLFGSSRFAAMPIDAYRVGDEYVVHVDIPGVDPSSIDVTVDNGSLTVNAARSWQPAEDMRVLAAERPQGSFTRQLFLGEGIETDRITAGYDNGVLTVHVPVSEHTTVRKVQVGSGDSSRTELASSSS